MPRSPDLQAIQAQVESYEIMDRFAREMGTGPKIVTDIEIMAQFMVGGHGSKFSALRALFRQLGSENGRYLLLYASQNSNTRFRIFIERRKDIHRADGGRRMRAWRTRQQMEDIGNIYYNARYAGKSDRDAIDQVRTDLRVNLSDETIRKKLDGFRKLVVERGYFDPHAPHLARWTGVLKEPEILVANITKRGRPKKIR